MNKNMGETWIGFEKISFNMPMPHLSSDFLSFSLIFDFFPRYRFHLNQTIQNPILKNRQSKFLKWNILNHFPTQHLSYHHMNLFYSHIIPLSLCSILLVLLYWVIRLRKIKDYQYAIIKWHREITKVWKEWELKKKGQECSQIPNDGEDCKIGQINLEKETELNRILSNANLKKINSILLNDNDDQDNAYVRKNSIDYNIQINQIDNNQCTPYSTLNHSQNHQLPQRQSYRSNTLQVNQFSNLNKKMQAGQQQNRRSFRQSTDYLKAYLTFKQNSHRQLISNRNMKSNKAISRTQSITNLYEMNGIKTIRDLIKEGI